MLKKPDPISLQNLRQLEIQDLVLAYLSVSDAIGFLHSHHRGEEELDNLYRPLESFASQASLALKTYATEFPGSRWALTTVPTWAAAGMAAGLPDTGVSSAAMILMFAGMEARRHIGAEEAEETLLKIVGPDRGREVTDSQIRQIASRIDRSPSGIRRPHTWKNVFFWATHRRHSEFLFTVMLRLGEWISRGGTPYDAVYEESLKAEGRKDLSLIQVQTRARNAAVRRFLGDYFERMKLAISELRMSAT